MGLQKVFIENPDFQLKNIEMSDAMMSAKDLVGLTGVDPGKSIFSADLPEVEKIIGERPSIVSIKVSRHLPDTLQVDLVERTPVAWIECRRLGIIGKDPMTGVMVDEEGFCFPCETWWESVAEHLPVIVVEEAEGDDFVLGKRLRHREVERGLALVQRSAHHLAGSNWSLPVIGVRNDFSLVAATNEGAVVTFGMYEHDRQLVDLLAILRHAEGSKRQVATVNLIPERNIPVIFQGDAPVKVNSGFDRPAGTRMERDVREILNRG